MNDHDLDRILRSSPVPERDEAYWKEFPESVERRIRAGQRAVAPPQRSWPRLRWLVGFGLSAAAVLVALLLLREKLPVAPADEQLAPLQACYRQIAEMFPGQLQAVVLSADGVQLQLSETGEVPNSRPLFVRICGPSSRCATAISFSGQKIRLADREFEVLATGAGQIFLVGKEGVWLPGQAALNGETWRCEAGWLQPL